MCRSKPLQSNQLHSILLLKYRYEREHLRYRRFYFIDIIHLPSFPYYVIYVLFCSFGLVQISRIKQNVFNLIEYCSSFSSVYISSAKFYAVIWLVLNLVTITKGRITFSLHFIIDCMTMDLICKLCLKREQFHDKN